MRRNAVKYQLPTMTGAIARLADYGPNDRAGATGRRVRLASVLPEQDRKARIAYAIENAMLRRHLTPPQLAERVGRSRGTVNDWIAGRSTPSLVDLGPLCAALSVDPKLFAELPPIPVDPLAEYLLEVAESGVAEGVRRATSRRRRAPSTPAPSPERSPRAAEGQSA